ncbi:MAG: hypothetical protein M1528_02530, partial [Candidatus Marsarchaeota archaeon]|nr:hypothetical protein [Candidatus Marsarchaeota archaeon]
PDYYMAKIGLSTLDIIEEVDEKFKKHKKNVEKYRRQEEEIAEELKKNDEKYRRQREEVYEELKKNDEKYRRQLERNPYAAFHEAVVEIKRGDLDSAINHLNRVIKSKLLLKRKAFVLMGIIEEKRRHRTKAKEWYGKARELDNGYIKYKKWYKKILKERW